jgi:hypothetical protein
MPDSDAGVHPGAAHPLLPQRGQQRQARVEAILDDQFVQGGGF